MMVTNFNAGEVTPLLRCRCDIDKYQSAAQCLENWEILPHGAIRKRPGSSKICEVSGRARLIPWEFGIGDGYVLALTDQTITILRNTTVIGTLSSPFRESELRMIKYIQSADVLFMVHPDHPVMTLSRVSGGWILQAASFSGGPFMDGNESDTTVSCSGTSGIVTLTASAAIFNVTCDDQIFRITHPNENCAIEHTFTSDGVSASIQAKGKWTLSTCGGWSGTLRLQRSYNWGASWQEYRIWTSNNSSNIESSGSETDNGVLYRLTMSNFKPSTETTIYTCYATFCVEKYWVDGIVLLNRTAGLTNVCTGTVIEPLNTTAATDDWAFGSWSGDKGYPRAVCFHADRLCFGGTRSQPQTCWMSAVGDYYNFSQSTDDDSAVDVTLRNDRVNCIEWMFPQGNKVLIGTLSMEGFIYPSDNGVITPSNVSFEKKTAYGCASISPLMVQDSMVFVQRGGQKLRCFQYDLQRDGYEATDISELAEHVMKPGVVEAAYKGLDYPALYFVRSDGEMAVLTFDRMQNVYGWGRWTTPGGEYESVCVLETNAGDELWVCVKRGTQHQIERFSSGLLQDCGTDYTAYYKSMPLESVQIDSFGQKKKLSRIGIKFHESRGGEMKAGSGEWEEADQRMSGMDDDEEVPLTDWEYETVPAGRWVQEESVEVRQRKAWPMVLLSLFAKA